MLTILPESKIIILATKKPCMDNNAVYRGGVQAIIKDKIQGVYISKINCGLKMIIRNIIVNTTAAFNVNRDDFIQE